MNLNDLTPSLAGLEGDLQQFKQSLYCGVPGIVVVDSKKPGPTLGITIHTHGNEPSGLAAASFLIKTCTLEHKLRSGRVIFVLNNLKATEQYFTALQISDTNEAKAAAAKTRSSSEVNFNRLPANVMDLPYNGNYELARARQLWPVWQQFDVGFDIHSTMQEAEPMIILCDGNEHSELLNGFPIEIVIRNIQNVQVGKPAASFYGKAGSGSIAIEAGSHENSQSFICAIRCCIALMQNLGMVEGKPQLAVKEFHEYHVADSLVTTDGSFTLERIFSCFEQVRQGDVLANNSQGIIRAPFDGHILFCGKKTKPERLGEEALFLSHPVRIRRS